MTIHFVHKKSPSAAAIPLIFVHGRPGSFHEVHKILPLLTEQAFHVVAPRHFSNQSEFIDPSLPGYCWSTNPTKKGFNIGKIEETFHKLMTALGYSAYIAQGGDWGSLISRRMAQFYLAHCKAIHLNMLFTIGTPRLMKGLLVWFKWITRIGPILLYDKRETNALKNFQKFMHEETGYQVLQPLEKGDIDRGPRKSKARSRRVWRMDYGIHSWLGYERSWTLVQISILGRMTN